MITNNLCDFSGLFALAPPAAARKKRKKRFFGDTPHPTKGLHPLHPYSLLISHPNSWILSTVRGLRPLRPNMHQLTVKLITLRRGGSGDDVGWGPLWPPAWSTARAIPGATNDHAATGVRRATIKAHPATPPHPRPYGILGWHLRLMCIGLRPLHPRSLHGLLFLH